MTEIFVLGHQRYGSFKPFNNTSDGVCVIVWDENALPVEKGDLTILHGIHANKSRSMTYDKGSATFSCRICGKTVSMSDALFNNILHRMSVDSLSSGLNDDCKRNYFCFAKEIRRFPGFVFGDSRLFAKRIVTP